MNLEAQSAPVSPVPQLDISHHGRTASGARLPAHCVCVTASGALLRAESGRSRLADTASSEASVRSQSEEARRLRRVPHAEDRGSSQRCLERGETALLRSARAERCAWAAAESRQQGGQGGEVQHEVAVVIGEAKEAADLHELG